MKIKMQENHKRKTTKSRPLQSVLVIKLKSPCVCNHSLYSISVTNTIGHPTARAAPQCSHNRQDYSITRSSLTCSPSVYSALGGRAQPSKDQSDQTYESSALIGEEVAARPVAQVLRRPYSGGSAQMHQPAA